MIPPWERCTKLPRRSKNYTSSHGEHVVVESEVNYDGFTYFGWCKFCGESVYANSDQDHWHPYRSFIIMEEPY